MNRLIIHLRLINNSVRVAIDLSVDDCHFESTINRHKSTNNRCLKLCHDLLPNHHINGRLPGPFHCQCRINDPFINFPVGNHQIIEFHSNNNILTKKIQTNSIQFNHYIIQFHSNNKILQKLKKKIIKKIIKKSNSIEFNH